MASETLERLDAFGWVVFASLLVCRDALFEMIDGLLTVDPALPSLAYLSLSPTVTRGHDMLYRALSEGRVDTAAFRAALWSQPIPTVGAGSCWPWAGPGGRARTRTARTGAPSGTGRAGPAAGVMRPDVAAIRFGATPTRPGRVVGHATACLPPASERSTVVFGLP